MPKKKPEKLDGFIEKKDVESNSSISALENMMINDERWWCMVIMMIEINVDQAIWVSLFETACKERGSCNIRALSYQNILEGVEKLSKENLDKSPLVRGVCHQAKKVLQENDTLPASLMAWLIKYFIYQLKRDNQLRETVSEQSFLLRNSNSKKSSSRDPKAQKINDLNSECKRPIVEPNLYIILTGFYDPDLPEELIKVGVLLTCILRVEGTKGEQSEESPCCQLSLNSTEQQFPETSSLSSNDHLKFWDALEEYRKYPKAHSAYDELALFTLRAPEASAPRVDNNTEKLKAEIYESVLRIAYEVFELRELNSAYLKSMKLEKFATDELSELSDTRMYSNILDPVPQEYVSVPLILHALLLQVEANYDQLSTLTSTNDVENNTTKAADSASKMKSQDSLIEAKLKALNVKYELDDELARRESETTTDLRCELILHGDSLNTTIRHLRIENEMVKSRIPSTNAEALLDDISRILWEPRVMGLWKEYKELSSIETGKYAHHLDGICKNFEKATVRRDELKHYLHLQMFDRMIFDSRGKERVSCCPKEEINSRSKSKLEAMASDRLTLSSIVSALDTAERSKSASGSTLKSEPKEMLNHRSKSDSTIDRGKSVSMFANCSELFDLIDPREFLEPGYLKKNILAKRPFNWPTLQDFEDVELLSSRVFAQFVYKSFLEFNHFEARYFKPTDSILIYFGSNDETYPVSHDETVFSIRTPVCFRDFCEYVRYEEKDWIERKRKEIRQQRSQLTERLMASSEQMILGDEHSIRAQSSKKRNGEKATSFLEKKELLRALDETSTSRGASSREKIQRKKKLDKQKNEKVTSDRESGKLKKRESRESVASDAMSSVTTRILSFRCTEDGESYEFIGYDLGRLRVQVSKRKTSFLSADGVLVSVEIEHWLYAATDLRIVVTIRGASLRLFHRIEDRQNHEPFHLTTETGIILAFCKTLSRDDVTSQSEDSWKELLFECWISTPTGLSVKHIIGDGPDNPFYIHQSYISMNHSNSDLGEICRKFLRNGTVLKYLTDGTITIFCPNGDIVNDLKFKTVERNGVEQFPVETTLAKGNTETKKMKLQKTKKRKSSLTKATPPPIDETSGINREASITLDQKVNNSSTSRSEMAGRVEVSRYRVVNHEGRQYEVLDDQVVSEHHRLLVRTATDYEVNEKLTRRADGTSMLLNSNGELIVTFPDGTRIITGYVIEENPVRCDWSDEEIRLYFASESCQEGEDYLSIASSDNRSQDEVSKAQSSNYSVRLTLMLIADGFVSILLTCRMEHKNYATVSYDQSTVNCTLSIPGNLRVSISREGHYQVSTPNAILKLQEGRLVFSGSEEGTCGVGTTSSCTYNFPSIRERSSRTIFTSTDLFGNVFEVKENGSTHYRKADQCKELSQLDLSREADQNGSSNNKSNKTSPTREKSRVVEGEPGEAEGEDRGNNNNNETNQYSENNGWHCGGCRKKIYRIFALNRNLTAYEYIDRFRKSQMKAVTAIKEGTSMISYRISRHPELRRLITFEPVEFDFSRSKLNRVEQMKFGKRELLRSTYSLPYDWLFPFGKNGNGIWQNSHEMPLVDVGRAIPKLLKIQALRGFKEPVGENLIDLQRALGRYWISLFQNSQERSVASVQSPASDEQIAVDADFENLEEDLRSLTLGIQTTIDVNVYIKGLEMKINEETKKSTRKSSKFLELMEQSSRRHEEIAWYRFCMRKNIIQPYFESIPGTCFLWIENLVRNIFRDSPKTQSVANSPDKDEEESLNENTHEEFHYSEN